MADGAQTDPQFNRTEHIDENVSAKRVVGYDYDPGSQQLQRHGVGYNYFQFDPNDNLPDYIGKNVSVTAADSDSTWVVYKFAYSGSNATSIKKKVGAWSARGSLF